MAKYVIKNPVITIQNSQTGSSHEDMAPNTRSVSITTVGAEVDVTAFSSTGHVERLGGLIDGSIDIDFFQDFDADSVYDTLKDELGEVIEIKVKPVDDTTAATNPEWTIKALVTEVPFISGAVGEASSFSVSWPFSEAPSIAITP